MRAVVSPGGGVRIDGLSPLLFLPLEDLLHFGHPVPDELICTLFSRLTALLGDLHASSGSHGAVSPATVVLTQGGGASLLAARPGALAGCYAARLPHAPGLAGDLFSLGCTLHAAAAGGAPPFALRGDGTPPADVSALAAVPALSGRCGAVRDSVAFLLRAPVEALRLLQAGRLRAPVAHAAGYAPAQSTSSPPRAVAAGSLSFAEISEGIARASPPRAAPAPPPPPPAAAAATASPAPPPGRGKGGLTRSPPSAAAARRPAPAEQPPAAAEADAAAAEARLARLARLRRDASAEAAAEAALAAARIEAHAARRALAAAHGSSGGGVAAAAAAHGGGATRANGALPRSPQQGRGATGARGSPAGDAEPPPAATTPTILDARARRAAAKQMEEERALEAARVAAFQGRLALAARAKGLYDSTLAGGEGGGGGGAGGGSSVSSAGASSSLGEPPSQLPAPPFAGNSSPMPGPPAGTTSAAQMRAARLQAAQAEEERALQAARVAAHQERLALRQKHGR
jgi:hypothetical protein